MPAALERDQPGVAKFGDQVKLSKDKQPLKDGDASVTDDDADAGKYPGYFYANVKGWPDNPPQLKHADKSPITDPGALTSGDWVYLPPHERHRVARTACGKPTLWLAVFLQGTLESPAP